MNVSSDEHAIESLKHAERAWHDAEYDSFAEHAFPDTIEHFAERYVNGQISRFCDGGWSRWGDARREALESVGDVRGLRVLDYGCGFGHLGMYLSLHGAHVWGFDLSQCAVETANKAAERYGLSAQFSPMDAAALTYPDEFFDLVIGFGVLHHVIKYPQADAHLFRVLKPGGRAVFHETLWDNPLINFVRRFTSVHSDAGDAPLTEREIHKFCRSFQSVQLEKRHLLYMLKRLAKLPSSEWNAQLTPRPFWRAVSALDLQILRFRALRRYCGEVLVYLQK
ncbi:MAG TPA: methyltransferase domain-containing protein [Candidatus Eisenbacteria bacterium]|nr:methyltransferase domain-containing protein [Candidatus Eisenbacteria bacterium]